ncbi:MAG: hypothetical protein JSS11_15285 [Verrucomicrobia bacterium]|nr:hypothetical protein [Verrucomicrobiota bacterium]
MNPAAEHLAQGQALEARGTPESLAAALQCFDRALAMLRPVARASEPESVRNLAVAWMNRGNVLQKLATPAALADAVAAYDEAIVLLQPIATVANLPAANSLGAAWLNRGHALQSQEPPAHVEALRSYRAAIDILGQFPPGTDRSVTLNLAGAWMNLANALLFPSAPDAPAARTAALTALALVVAQSETDAVAADLTLKSLRVQCDALGHLLVAAESDITTVRTFAQEAGDAADQGLALVRQWEARGFRHFRHLAARFHHFGAQLYLVHQPHFLAEFLLEPIDPEKGPGAITDEPALHTFAVEYATRALEALRATSLQGLTDYDRGRLVEASQELQSALARLPSLRP